MMKIFCLAACCLSFALCGCASEETSPAANTDTVTANRPVSVSGDNDAGTSDIKDSTVDEGSEPQGATETDAAAAKDTEQDTTTEPDADATETSSSDDTDAPQATTNESP